MCSYHPILRQCGGGAPVTKNTLYQCCVSSITGVFKLFTTYQIKKVIWRQGHLGKLKASGNGKGGLKFSPGCLGTLGAPVLSGFAKIWHKVPPPSPPTSLFSLVPLNSTKSEMRPLLWLQLHLVTEIKSPDNRCKMQRNVPALTF